MELLFASNNEIVGINNTRLVRLNSNLKIVAKGDFVFKSIFSRFSIFRRLFREQIYSKVLISGNEIVASNGSDLILVNLEDLTCKIIDTPKSFKKSLDLNVISINGIPHLIYSNYSQNQALRPLKIYVAPVDDLNSYRKYSEFNAELINHIHSYVQDPKNEDLYISVGDIDKTSGIWKINKESNHMLPILVDGQKYRSVILEWVNGEIVLINDCPSADNYLFKIQFTDGINFAIKRIGKINGPCIYSSRIGSKIYFSSCIEPPRQTLLMKILPFWVMKQRSILYEYDPVSSTLKELTNGSKDFLNPYLFGFGTFKFALHSNKSKLLYTSFHGMKKTLSRTNIVKLESNIVSIKV